MTSRAASAADRPTRSRPGLQGRPWALTILWILVMAPAALAGPLLQGPLGVDDRVLPLVMIGPAVAWLACRLAVPRWFPSESLEPPARPGWRSWLATAGVSLTFVATLLAVTPSRPAIMPATSPEVLGALAVAGGMLVGSWCEEIGFRGVMYRALAPRLGTWTAIILNGLFFGLCHLQYLDSGIGVAMFLTTTVLLDIAMVAAWDGSWSRRVLQATVIHAVANAALQLRGVMGSGAENFLPFLLATGAAALAAVVLGRVLGVGDLRRPPRSVRRGTTTGLVTDTLGA